MFLKKQHSLASWLFLVLTIAGCQSVRQPVNALPDSGSRLIDQVNVFLGSSGDHGQMSPAASYPFSMLSIGPQTYPSTHTGYEFLAKKFLGFTHTRLEGVGCLGSGGNLLVKPFTGTDSVELIKQREEASPGYYHVGFTNGIDAEFTVADRYGMHHYTFPQGESGFLVDLSFATVNRFVEEGHEQTDRALSGWIETGTTCGAGKYKLYFYLEFDQPVSWKELAPHQLMAMVAPDAREVNVHIGLSSVDVEYARRAVTHQSFEALHLAAQDAWETSLAHIEVTGPADRTALFYSYLYRAIQSPYVISETDGAYRAIDGSLQTKATGKIYHGWAIWDNYRTQLPLLSLAFSDRYGDIAASIANLYPYGKKDFATQHEPTLTVRTEHSMVVLLDAYKKGYPVDFASIKDSLIAEIERIDTSHPDKALEAAYDAWALSNIMDLLGDPELSAVYREKALSYKDVWQKDFADITRKDVDRMGARGMYQGTIWQYRWFVPFDNQGLMDQAGGEAAFIRQLDQFFAGDYYNHANQPDLQTSGMYQGTSEPWKSQAIIHKIAVDTMIQNYFNDNSRGSGVYVGRIYKNQPATYLRTMDDDAGTMSSWYVWASCGLFPACIGEPVYYLHAPLMETVKIAVNGKSFSIRAKNFDSKYAFIQSASLNGKPLNRNWLTQQEILAGGVLEVELGAEPNREWGTAPAWVTHF